MKKSEGRQVHHLPPRDSRSSQTLVNSREEREYLSRETDFSDSDVFTAGVGRATKSKKVKLTFSFLPVGSFPSQASSSISNDFSRS